MSGEIRDSRIPGFYNLAPAERLIELAKRWDLSEHDQGILQGQAGLSIEQADHMVENVVGLHSLPLGIALNFQVNGRDDGGKRAGNPPPSFRFPFDARNPLWYWYTVYTPDNRR